MLFGQRFSIFFFVKYQLCICILDISCIWREFILIGSILLWIKWMNECIAVVVEIVDVVVGSEWICSRILLFVRLLLLVIVIIKNFSFFGFFFIIGNQYLKQNFPSLNRNWILFCWKKNSGLWNHHYNQQPIDF